MEQNAHVLIPGGAGYIGSIVTERLLAAGYRVTVLDNLWYQQRSLLHLASHPLFDFAFGDMRDRELMRSLLKTADVVIPLAAIVGAPACDRDPELARSLNLDAVRTLLSLRSPEQLVIFPATDSGYVMRPGETLITEDSLFEPKSLYARLKAEAEAEVLKTPNAVSLRLATLFGVSPRMRLDLLVNHFVHAALNDGYLVVFEKSFKRQFVHVRDVAEAFLFTVQNGSRMAGKAHNVGSAPANISKEELAYAIKKHLPDLFIHFADVREDPDKRNFTVSYERLRLLGFQAGRSLDYGIRELIKAYRMMRGPSLIRNA
ncbi:MAG: NAD(P)-dependent oxidoreductase [Candidatus Sungbacteria bacterium]|nr:NAD(P)-dependent oxidoreductase [Candidatus Sungbacteria bacterium]